MLDSLAQEDWQQVLEHSRAAVEHRLPFPGVRLHLRFEQPPKETVEDEDYAHFLGLVVALALVLPAFHQTLDPVYRQVSHSSPAATKDQKVLI